MLDISTEIKDLYKQVGVVKELELYFPSIELTITKSNIVAESMELIESICSDKDIVYGACEGSMIKYTLHNIGDDLTGLSFVATHIINGNRVPLGCFTVYSCKRQDDFKYKDVLAYDSMTKFDVNVADWYNGLTFPMTLAAFRTSLLTYLGIEQEAQTLPNDDMIVTKTIEPSQISGRVVLEATVELNGAFGNINRCGRFRRIILQPAYGLYPSETLYPSDNIYPVSETDTTFTQDDLISEHISKAMYQSVKFEEYTVKEIDKLIIRSEEDDIGAIVGTGSNAYVIKGNFLVYGKSAAELEQIAINAFGNMAKRPYRPYEGESIGLPYIEVGDTLEFATDDVVTGYVLQRTLTGIQALQDEYISPGSEEREQNFGLNKELIQLQGKLTRIKKDVEGVSVEVEDLAQETSTKFTQTYNDIGLKVDKAGVIQSINLSPEGAKINVTKLDITGIVTITALNTPGSVVIDGGNLKAGTVVADTVRADWVYTNNINANQIVGLVITGNEINGGTISGVTFISTGSTSSDRVSISNGAIILGDTSSYHIELDGGKIRFKIGSTVKTRILHEEIATATVRATDMYAVSLSATGSITSPYIYGTSQVYSRGYAVIDSGNISSQSVSFASGAGSASTASQLKSTAGSYAYVSASDNLIPSRSGMYVGSSSNYWAGAYLGSGPVVTSDKNKKHDIESLSEKYLEFAKKIMPRVFKYNDGTSGRAHIGFIAQEIESAMTECGISDLEFAGLIKAPIYSKKIIDEDGSETQEYDMESDIVGFDYGLRYEEFIPLIFALYLEMIKN